MIDVVAALLWRNGQFLICQRPKDKARGLLWEFVGGKVEAGESKQEALVRECREELGIEINVKDMFMELDHAYPDISIHLTLFHAEISKGTPRALEHSALKWILPEEIPQYDFCPADKDILCSVQLRTKLISLQDPSYKKFHCSLMPGVDPDSVIGVRMPDLRKLAKDMEREASKCLLRSLPHKYYEENNLHGILISQMRDYDEAVDALNDFLPHINNWATCDLIAPKAFAKHPEQLPAQIDRWLSSKHPYTVRFAIGMLMKYYLDDAFEPKYLATVASIQSSEYYINMMIAWYFATALFKQYDHTIVYLENNKLSAWIHNKTIQKAIESYRICSEAKEYFKTLRRK